MDRRLISIFAVFFRTVLLVVVASLVTTVIAIAQGSAEYGKGLKLEFDDAENKFVRFVFWNQFWAGPVQNNPGTVINGEATETSTLMGARRSHTLERYMGWCWCLTRSRAVNLTRLDAPLLRLNARST